MQRIFGKLGIVLIFVMLLLATSCEEPVGQNGNPANLSHENLQAPEGKIVLRMDLSDIVEGSRADEDEYYLIYENITQSNELFYMLLESTDASLILEKGGIYVIGVAKKMRDDDGEYIKVIGILGDDHYGLRCFPVGEDATEVVDLGRLIQDGEILKSSVPPEEFARMIGYSEDLLEQIAVVDVTFKNFLNPDIDRDGVIDIEENLHWRLEALHYLTDYPGYDEESNPAIEEESFNWIFFKKRLEGEDIDPNDATLVYLDGGIEIKGFGRYENGDYIIQFDRSGYSDAPWNGNYLIELGEHPGKKHVYHFDNMVFISPTEFLSGLLLPAYRIVAFSDGKVKRIKWKWYLIDKGGNYKPVDERVVKLMVKTPPNIYLFPSKLFHSFGTHEGAFIMSSSSVTENPFADSDLDVSGKDIWLNSMGIYSWKKGSFGLNEVGGNEMKMFISNEVIPKPHDYDPDIETYELGSTETIAGTWINVSYLIDGSTRPYWIEFKADGEIVEKHEGYSQRGKYSIETIPGSKIRVEIEGKTHYWLVRMARTYMEVQYSEDDFPESIDPTGDNYMIFSRYYPYGPIVEDPSASVSASGVRLEWHVSNEEFFNIYKYIVYYSKSLDEVMKLCSKRVETFGNNVNVDLRGEFYWRVEVVLKDGKKIPGPIFRVSE